MDHEPVSRSHPPRPEYDAPPVSEVGLAIHFAPLAGWQSAHAGLFWGQISNEYPTSEVQPPIPAQIEKFDAEDLNIGPTIQFSQWSTDRYWFISEDKTRVLQIQPDRFIGNWRKVVGDEIYPRYTGTIRPWFEREWKRYKAFVQSRNLGSLEVLQCEITYVNDIVRGQEWNEFSEALALFSYWSGGGSDGFLPLPEMLFQAASFLMPDKYGRLHVNTQRAIRKIDQKEVIKFNLFARGRPDSSSDQDVMSWMDLGREWIVRGFTDLTTRKAHSLWKRRT